MEPADSGQIVQSTGWRILYIFWILVIPLTAIAIVGLNKFLQMNFVVKISQEVVFLLIFSVACSIIVSIDWKLWKIRGRGIARPGISSEDDLSNVGEENYRTLNIPVKRTFKGDGTII